MKRKITCLILVICMVVPMWSVTLQAEEVFRLDDYQAFTQSLHSVDGTILFNNFDVNQTTQGGIVQPLTIKLNTDTKITWLATYHDNTKDFGAGDPMNIVLTLIDPTKKGADKTIQRYSYKTTSYNISPDAEGKIYPKNHYVVATPNMTFPKGEYVVSVTTGTSYFGGVDMTMAKLLEDLDQYASDFTWLGNPTSGDTTKNTGSLILVGIPTNLPAGTNAVDKTNSMDLATVQKEIKTIEDAQMAAYVASDQYKKDWALVEEELEVAAAYNAWLAQQQAAAKAKEANKPITLVVNGYTVPTKTAPVIKDGRTLVPIRALSEALDCSVGFDSKTKIIQIGDNNTGEILLVMKLNSRKVSVLTAAGIYDDRIMEVAPELIGSSTMVPVRFVAEAMNFAVSYSKETRTITITSDGYGYLEHSSSI